MSAIIFKFFVLPFLIGFVVGFIITKGYWGDDDYWRV